MLKVKAVDGLAIGETAFANCGASAVDHCGLGEQPREGPIVTNLGPAGGVCAAPGARATTLDRRPRRDPPLTAVFTIGLGCRSKIELTHCRP